MLEAGIIQYTNALGVLMGLYPWDVREIMETRKPLPEYIETIGIGIPANLLLRRPDIRAAERLVNARAASLGASKSDWWPKVFVKGSVGFASHDLDKLVNHNSLTYEIAPGHLLELLPGNEVGAGDTAGKSPARRVDPTIQPGCTDSCPGSGQCHEFLQELDQTNCRAREVVNQGSRHWSFRSTSINRDLLLSRMSWTHNAPLLSYENELTQARGSSLLSLIQLYQALGGSWENEN